MIQGAIPPCSHHPIHNFQEQILRSAKFLKAISDRERIDEHEGFHIQSMFGFVTSFEGKKMNMPRKNLHFYYMRSLDGGFEILAFASRSCRFKSSDFNRSSPSTGSESVTSRTARAASLFGSLGVGSHMPETSQRGEPVARP